jgi:hypothetical protein
MSNVCLECSYDPPEGHPGQHFVYTFVIDIDVSRLIFNFLCLLLLQVSISMEITGKVRRGNVLLDREGGWKYRQRGEVGYVAEGERRGWQKQNKGGRERRQIWRKM